MRRALPLLLMLALVIACSQAPKSVYYDGTFEQAQALAQESGKLILVDFFSHT